LAEMVAVVAPADTDTEAGTVNAELLLDSVTVAPAEGAACEIVTVHVELPPEVTVEGVHCRLVTVICGATVMEAVAEPPFSEAVTVTAWFAVTVPAVAENVPVVAPAATVIEDGSVNAVLLSETETTLPPEGAACEIVTAHVALPPELTVEGVHCRLVTVTCGATVTEAVAELPFSEAVTVTA